MIIIYKYLIHEIGESLNIILYYTSLKYLKQSTKENLPLVSDKPAMGSFNELSPFNIRRFCQEGFKPSSSRAREERRRIRQPILSWSFPSAKVFLAPSLPQF
jgi:hypothetical protein